MRSAAKLAEIQRKLAAVQKNEESPASWSGISYAMQRPIGAATLASVEASAGIDLPAEYRSFLLEIGNGGAGPGYGLYSLEAALAERGEGIYDLDEPFEPPRDSTHWVDFRAPGMLPIHYDGCEYYGGLVISGPARGTMWSYVAVGPGWIPYCKLGYVDHSGEPFVIGGSDTEHYEAMYDARLLEVNARSRMTFFECYEDWLDGIVRAAQSN